MKKFIFFIALLPLVAGSCKHTLETYNGENRISFVPRDEPGETIGFTFLFHADDIRQDTLWLEVATMGFVTNYDRPVTLRQIDGEGNKAQPGVHYVAFDDTELQKHYVVKAGQNGALIPVVLLRDPSMQENEYTLDVELVANDAFLLGYEDRLVCHLTVSEMPAQPEEWTQYIQMNVLGDYGPVKYLFMIDVVRESGFDFVPDGPWIGSIEESQDSALKDYWQLFFQNALEEENARRAERGEEPLREADGTPVDFFEFTWPF